MKFGTENNSLDYWGGYFTGCECDRRYSASIGPIQSASIKQLVRKNISAIVKFLKQFYKLRGEFRPCNNFR